MTASLSQTLLKLLLSFAAAEAESPPAEPVCDDGSSPYDENGEPNLECEIDECAVGEPLCWSERLDICYDHGGAENGSCQLLDKACRNGLSCWGLYITCVGEWSCRDSQWWGCGRGTCLEPKR
ncbi:MAG TPA: hypothetical protein VK034_00765 [Enhygromyxa sp.]|nr:hypothetical protein [Enhygromyxa sp.]